MNEQVTPAPPVPAGLVGWSAAWAAVSALGLFAVVWTAGLIAAVILVPSLLGDPVGLAIAGQILIVLATAWIPILREGLRRRWAAVGYARRRH